MRTLSKISFLFIFLFLIVSNLSAQDMNAEAGKLYNEANGLLKQGDYSGAVKKYDAALNIEKDYRIYYQKGVALKKEGKLDDAKDAFESCAAAKPDFEAAFNALGGVYFSMGNYDLAVKNFEKVINNTDKASIKTKAKKNIAYAYAKLGNKELADGNAKNAIGYLTKAVENSNYDAAYLSLAKVYSETGQYDKSLDAAEKALKYRDNIGKGGPYYYMGVAYKNKGDLDKAKEMFKNARSDASYRKLSDYELSSLD